MRTQVERRGAAAATTSARTPSSVFPGVCGAQGTHTELMAAEGGYARLVAAQNQNKEGGGAQAGVGTTQSKRAKGGSATVVPAVADSPQGAGEEQ